MIKKIIFSLSLLSTLTSNHHVTAMLNMKEIIHLSKEELLLFKEKGEHPFLIIDNIKHYAYPDPNHNTYKSNPTLFSDAFMHSLNKNLDWREQNGHSDYERTHYRNEQRKALVKLRQQIHQDLTNK